MTWVVARHLHPLDIDILKSTEHYWDFEKAWRFGDSISAYRYSATFLSTLRTNIQLSTTDSIPYSPMVPLTIHSRLPNPSPTSFSIMTSYQRTDPAPTADPLPKLTTYTPDTNTEKLSALRLIADSVAQQRQEAVKAILANSYVMATLALILALEAYWLNPIVLLTTGSGTIMTVLVGIRWLTGGYISAAERINWDWLTDTTSPVSSSTSNHSHTYSNGHKRGRSATIEEPFLLVTRWGEEIIGALVIRVSKREKKGFVRAWTVARRYRGKGVGKALLEEGVKLVMGKAGVKGVGFDDEGAYSEQHLPPFFNASFETRNEQAEELLARTVAATKIHRRTNS